MFQVDLKSRKTICRQVIDNLKNLIITGILKPEDKLPSVRELSHTLTVNPNTVQKSYRELERQGYVYTSPGIGTFVAHCENVKINHSRLPEITAGLRREIAELYYLRIPLSEARKILDDLLNEKEDWK